MDGGQEMEADWLVESVAFDDGARGDAIIHLEERTRCKLLSSLSPSQVRRG
jgi:hypothetical protein